MGNWNNPDKDDFTEELVLICLVLIQLRPSRFVIRLAIFCSHLKFLRNISSNWCYSRILCNWSQWRECDGPEATQGLRGEAGRRTMCAHWLCSLRLHKVLSRDCQLPPRNPSEHSVLMFSVLRIFHVNYFNKICPYDPIWDTRVFGIKPKSHLSLTNKFLTLNNNLQTKMEEKNLATRVWGKAKIAFP